MRIKEVKPEEAMALIKDGAVLVDVREHEEFDELHIENATLLPLSEFLDNYQQLPQDHLVLVCAGGVRSAQATQFLSNQGFQVANLEGGIKAWIEAGLPVWRRDANS